MENLYTGEPLDAAAELEYLLQHNGFSYQREENRFSLVFADRGCKWETLGLCRGGQVLLYGSYPFPVQESDRTLRLCQEINRQVVMGSMVLAEGRAVFRTGADLLDAYSAYEQIGRALEYNAGVMVRFWAQMAACAAGHSGDLGIEPVFE